MLVNLILAFLLLGFLLLSFFFWRIHVHLEVIFEELAKDKAQIIQNAEHSIKFHDEILEELSSVERQSSLPYLQSYFANLLHHIPNPQHVLLHQHNFFLALAENDLPRMKEITEIVFKEVQQKYSKVQEPPTNFILGN